jgi:hypothetical protein
MPHIGHGTPISYRQKRVRLTTVGAAVPDADGGYTQAEVALDPPQAWVRVQPVSKADLEALAGGTVLAQASHRVSLPYHPGVTIDTTLWVEDHPHPERRFTVVYIANPNERNADLELVCAEVLS